MFIPCGDTEAESCRTGKTDPGWTLVAEVTKDAVFLSSEAGNTNSGKKEVIFNALRRPALF